MMVEATTSSLQHRNEMMHETESHSENYTNFTQFISAEWTNPGKKT